MASTAAALNGAIVAAVYIMLLLHSAMGQQLSPVPHCHDSMGQQPAPAPAPAAPTPMSAPAPAPAVDCTAYCNSQCNSNCTAGMGAALAKCDTDYATNFNACYDYCTSQKCPGKSCVHSGCGIGNCSCENTNARTCCQDCSSILSTTYFQCRYFIERSVPPCMNSCMNDCHGSCTQRQG